MLPKSQVALANMLYRCIDLGDYEENYTLLQIINQETYNNNEKPLTAKMVTKWLRGLPSACSIPFADSDIRQILDSAGNKHWSIDDYWNWAGDRILTYAKRPHIYN